MALSIWDVGDIISRWLIYMGVAAAIGGSFIGALIRANANIQPIVRYIRLCLCLGITAVIINFFMAVGAASQTGFFGLFDGESLHLLWHGPSGDALFWRLFGFTAIAALFLLHLRRKPAAQASNRKLFFLCYFSGILALSYSFTLLGNTAELGSGASWLMALHIITSAWWLGALYPLLICYQLLNLASLYRVMRFFGQLTLIMVPLLLLGGGGLLSQVLASSADLFTTTYGQTMLLKLITVTTVFLLVVLHKHKYKHSLVPALNQVQMLTMKRNAIISELFLADIILVITAVLSSILGPVVLS
ncbi:CopD family protein [Thalassomonas haliotis]|uniref:Copper resistance protein D n=1 Tax=Thalassomonas haliotis TaxID=485448 RepID=A0ABY7V9P0_9GAMM|nr:CopD family protein [Thalassomonas haliotis]WDE10261.1 CopD family protein [Thalassomonas haliotis]